MKEDRTGPSGLSIGRFLSTILSINQLVVYGRICNIPTNEGRYLGWSWKGHAWQLFLRTPTSIKEVCDRLLLRFKPKETMTDLTDKLHNLSQEQRTVDNFAKEIELISYKLLQLHMIGKSDAAEGTVREMNEFAVVEAFKRGLRKELETLL